MAAPARKTRSDALQNRERLVEAAAEVLGQGGPAASLDSVARRAGVGIGTLYRHFPTREALFQAVYRSEVEQLIALAADLEEMEDSHEALRSWLHAGVRLVATKRGVLGALAVVLTDESKALYDELSIGMNAAATRLIARARTTGALREDITAEDLLQTMYALCYARKPEPGWERQVLRLLDIFIDGLRAG